MKALGKGPPRYHAHTPHFLPPLPCPMRGAADRSVFAASSWRTWRSRWTSRARAASSSEDMLRSCLRAALSLNA